MRRKKPINYIRELLDSGDPEGKRVGRELLEKYRAWKESLRLADFLDYLSCICEKHQATIQKVLRGLPQMIGQFRAYSLEEYVRELLIRKCGVDPQYVFWNHDLVIWKKGRRSYSMKVDVLVQKEKPLLVVETKVDVDAPRLKALLMNSLLAKKVHKGLTVFLVYVKWNASAVWKEIASLAVDDVFDFEKEEEVGRFSSRAGRILRSLL